MTTPPATTTERMKMTKREDTRDARNQDIENTRRLLHLLIRALVDHPAEVQVEAICGSQAVMYEIRVDPDDVRRIIGRKGRTADACREMLMNLAAKARSRFLLEILELE